MEIDRKILPLTLLAAAFVLAVGCVPQPNVSANSADRTNAYQARRWSSPAFTTAHPTYTDAAKHFLNIRPKPVQPIDFPHEVHTFDIGVGCEDCHAGVARGAVAGIPSVDVCMSCHEDIGESADSRIQKLRDFVERGEDLAWQRVYGFLEEAHVRFNHAPHGRAGVECATCHGDLSQMTVAERAVDHTMGFCVNCHKEKKASNDCLVCHF